MRLSQKLTGLRELEGLCRGSSRALSKAETVKLIRDEIGEKISLGYLSQLETGKRLHMTNTTRLLLSRFFRVHPGYLVDDPEDFREHLATPTPASAGSLVAWLRAGAAQFRHDSLVSGTLERLASEPDQRKAFRVLRHLLTMPGLLDRLLLTLEARPSATRKG